MIATMAVLEEAIEWLGPAFTVAGYWIIVAAVLLERSAFIGLVVPGEVTLVLGAVYAARGELVLAWVIVAAVLAAVAGESIGYGLGRRYGQSLLGRLPLLNRLEPKIDDIRGHFENSGGMMVAVGRYATAAGAFVPFVAGMAGMPFRRFLAYDVPAIVVWAVGVSVLGFVFGRNLDLVERILSQFGWGMLGVLVLLIVGRILWKRYKD